MENRLLYCDTSWNWVTEHEKHISVLIETSTNGTLTGRVRNDHDIMLTLIKVTYFVNFLHLYYFGMFWSFIDNFKLRGKNEKRILLH